MSVIHLFIPIAPGYSKEQNTFFFILFILFAIVKICSYLGVTVARMSAGK